MFPPLPPSELRAREVAAAFNWNPGFPRPPRSALHSADRSGLPSADRQIWRGLLATQNGDSRGDGWLGGALLQPVVLGDAMCVYCDFDSGKTLVRDPVELDVERREKRDIYVMVLKALDK
jgi:hypothetical protein